MEKIAVSVSVEEVDNRLTVKLQVGDSISFLGANEALLIAEAMAEASGFVEGYNAEAGITEPEVEFQRGEDEGPKVEFMSVEDFMEGLNEALQEEILPEKKHLH